MTTPTPDAPQQDPAPGSPPATPIPGAATPSAATPSAATPEAAPQAPAVTQPVPAWTAPGYAAPGYPPAGYPAEPQRTDDKAVWSLVSAIAGFILCPIVLHVVGLVLANQSLRSIRTSGGRLGGEGLASTARILSIVGLVLYGAAIVLGLLLLVIAVPLGIFTFGTVANDIEDEQLSVAPTRIAAIDGREFQHEAGQISYDLSGIDFTDRTAETSINVGAGTLLVEVPEDVTVVLDAEVGGGELAVFGDRTDGIGLSRQQTFEGTPSGGTLELELDMGVGEVTLERAG